MTASLGYCWVPLGQGAEQASASCYRRGRGTGLLPCSSCLSLVGAGSGVLTPWHCPSAQEKNLRWKVTDGESPYTDGESPYTLSTCPRKGCRGRTLEMGPGSPICRSPHHSPSPVCLAGGRAGFLPPVVTLVRPISFQKGNLPLRSHHLQKLERERVARSGLWLSLCGASSVSVAGRAGVSHRSGKRLWPSWDVQGPPGRWLSPEETPWSCAKLSACILSHPPSPQPPRSSLMLHPPGSRALPGSLAGKKANLWLAHPTPQRPRGTPQMCLDSPTPTGWSTVQFQQSPEWYGAPGLRLRPPAAPTSVVNLPTLRPAGYKLGGFPRPPTPPQVP